MAWAIKWIEKTACKTALTRDFKLRDWLAIINANWKSGIELLKWIVNTQLNHSEVHSLWISFRSQIFVYARRDIGFLSACSPACLPADVYVSRNRYIYNCVSVFVSLLRAFEQSCALISWSVFVYCFPHWQHRSLGVCLHAYIFPCYYCYYFGGVCFVSTLYHYMNVACGSCRFFYSSSFSFFLRLDSISNTVCRLTYYNIYQSEDWAPNSQRIDLHTNKTVVLHTLLHDITLSRIGSNPVCYSQTHTDMHTYMCKCIPT